MVNKPEAYLGLLQHPRWSRLAVDYYYKVLPLGCCSSPRSASSDSEYMRSDPFDELLFLMVAMLC